MNVAELSELEVLRHICWSVAGRSASTDRGLTTHEFVQSGVIESLLDYLTVQNPTKLPQSKKLFAPLSSLFRPHQLMPACAGVFAVEKHPQFSFLYSLHLLQRQRNFLFVFFDLPLDQFAAAGATPASAVHTPRKPVASPSTFGLRTPLTAVSPTATLLQTPKDEKLSAPSTPAKAELTTSTTASTPIASPMSTPKSASTAQRPEASGLELLLRKLVGALEDSGEKFSPILNELPNRNSVESAMTLFANPFRVQLVRVLGSQTEARRKGMDLGAILRAAEERLASDSSQSSSASASLSSSFSASGSADSSSASASASASSGSGASASTDDSSRRKRDRDESDESEKPSHPESEDGGGSAGAWSAASSSSSSSSSSSRRPAKKRKTAYSRPKRGVSTARGVTVEYSENPSAAAAEEEEKSPRSASPPRSPPIPPSIEPCSFADRHVMIDVLAPLTAIEDYFSAQAPAFVQMFGAETDFKKFSASASASASTSASASSASTPSYSASAGLKSKRGGGGAAEVGALVPASAAEERARLRLAVAKAKAISQPVISSCIIFSPLRY